MADIPSQSAPERDSPPSSAPEEPAGAPALTAPADPALSAALDAFRSGDFRAAAAAAPGTVADVGDDRIHLARLQRGLGWEPTLWIAAALASAAWLWAFLSSQPS